MKNSGVITCLATCAFSIAGNLPVNGAGPNLLVNGSFEEPVGGSRHIAGGSTEITGWITQLDGVEVFTATDIGLGFPYPSNIADGVQAIDLPPFTYSGGGGISQTFDTVPGVTYDVNFSAGTVASFGKSGFGSFLATVGSAVKYYSLENPGQDWVWEAKAFNFTASGTTATLTFVSLDDPNRFVASIDNVSVTAVPEVEHCAMAGGLALLGFATLRRFRQV